MQLDRRKLIQGVAAGSATLAGASAATLASNQATPESSPVKKLNQLRIAMQALPPHMDPQVGFGLVQSRMNSLVFETLIKRDWANKGELVPGLAKNWSRIDDLTLEFELQDGVTFHNGTPMTASDVKFTLDRLQAGDSTLLMNGHFPPAEITVVDELNLRIVTKDPSPAFELLLTDAAAGAIISEKYFEEIGADAFLLAPMGTGPYSLTEYVPDGHLSFEAYEGYWGTAAPIQSILVSGVPEISTRIAALFNGEQDIIADLPVDHLETVQADGGYNISTMTPLNVQTLTIQGTKTPMDNQKVRQALSLAIDRGLIVDQILMGEGVWPGGAQSKADPLYIERDPLPYDPDHARELLAESGYAGEEIVFQYDSPDYYPLQSVWSQVIAQMWIDVGFNIKMVGLDVSQRGDGEFHLVTTGGGVIMDTILPRGFIGDETYLTNRYEPGTFDEIEAKVLEMSVTMDPKVRGEMTSEIVDMLNEQVPEVVLFQINRAAASQSNIVWSENPDHTIEFRSDNFSFAE